MSELVVKEIDKEMIVDKIVFFAIITSIIVAGYLIYRGCRK